MDKIKITNLGSRLRAWRKSIPLKAYQLAKLIKISQGSLSDIENNKSLPSADTIYKLWKLTEINVGWLLSGKEEGLRSIGEGAAEKPDKEPMIVTLNSFETEVLIRYTP